LSNREGPKVQSKNCLYSDFFGFDSQKFGSQLKRKSILKILTKEIFLNYSTVTPILVKNKQDFPSENKMPVLTP